MNALTYPELNYLIEAHNREIEKKKGNNK